MSNIIPVLCTVVRQYPQQPEDLHITALACPPADLQFVILLCYITSVKCGCGPN